jgi:hypothetical protein
VRDPGELLSRTFSGFSARVDYQRRLKMNTQDGDKDVLFRQEIGREREGTWASPTSGELRERSAEPLRQCCRQKSRGICWGLSWLQSEGGVCSGGAWRTDSAPVLRRIWSRQVSAVRCRDLQGAGV